MLCLYVLSRFLNPVVESWIILTGVHMSVKKKCIKEKSGIRKHIFCSIFDGKGSFKESILNFVMIIMAI